MPEEDLIFDRTQEDLINKTSKSYYNYDDLNRIESWCSYLDNLLNEYSYKVNITVKTNWTMLDFPTNAHMERIRSNINALKTAYYAITETPENLELMTIQKANAIEKILYDIDYLLDRMIASFRPCGTFACAGMEGLI